MGDLIKKLKDSKRVHFKHTSHEFIKQNQTTLNDEKGLFDYYVCGCCGLSGKMRVFYRIDIDPKIGDKSVIFCKNVKV